MFWTDPKKNAATIIARRHKDGSRTAAPMKPEETLTEPGEVDGKHVAAQDMLAAQHEGSAQKFSEALGHYLDMHMSGAATTPKE